MTRNRCLWAAVPALVLALSVPASAQQVVGKALVEGKTVLLFDNQTWEFETKPSGDAGCKTVNIRVQFCGPESVWRPTRPASSEIQAAYRYDDTHYGQFIEEAIGRNVGLTEELLPGILLQNAEMLSGGPPVQIDQFDSLVDGHPAHTLVYQVTTQGMKVVFFNTYVLGDTTLLQVMTYVIAASPTDADRALHDQFLGLIRYSLD